MTARAARRSVAQAQGASNFGSSRRSGRQWLIRGRVRTRALPHLPAPHLHRANRSGYRARQDPPRGTVNRRTYGRNKPAPQKTPRVRAQTPSRHSAPLHIGRAFPMLRPCCGGGGLVLLWPDVRKSLSILRGSGGSLARRDQDRGFAGRVRSPRTRRVFGSSRGSTPKRICRACEERLAWLSGFTGSAGLAIVLKGSAAIFVDGRYSLAVKDQVDLSIFKPVAWTETSPSDWLEANLRPGARLGYDPWLHTLAR